MSGIVGENVGSASGLVKAAGAGGLLQVKSTTKNDVWTSTANGPVAITGLSVAITPTLSTSKILVRASIVQSGITNSYQNFFLYRDVGGAGYSILAGSIGDGTGGTYGDTVYTRATIPAHTANGETFPWHPTVVGFEHLDAPATTSEVTYAMYRDYYGTGTPSHSVNEEEEATDATSDGRYISTITAMEFAVGVL